MPKFTNEFPDSRIHFWETSRRFLIEISKKFQEENFWNWNWPSTVQWDRIKTFYDLGKHSSLQNIISSSRKPWIFSAAVFAYIVYICQILGRSYRKIECIFEKPDEGFLLKFQKKFKRKNLWIGIGSVLSSEIESKLSMILEIIPHFNIPKLQLENHENSRQHFSPYTISIC